VLLQAFELMAQHMTPQEKLNPKSVTAARKNEVCAAAGAPPSTYNQMAAMHHEARAAFKSWCVRRVTCAHCMRCVSRAACF